MARKKNKFLIFLIICLLGIIGILVIQNYKLIMAKIAAFDLSAFFVSFPAMQGTDTRIYPADADNYLFFTKQNQLGMAALKNRSAWKILWTARPEDTFIQDIAVILNTIIVDGRKISGQDNTGSFLFYNTRGKQVSEFKKETAFPHITVKIFPVERNRIIVAGYEYPRTVKSGLYAGLYTNEGKVIKEELLPETANLSLEYALLTAKGECLLVCLQKKLFRITSTVVLIKLDAELAVIFNQDTTRELNDITSVTEESADRIVLTGGKKSGVQRDAQVITFDFSRKDWYLY